MRVVREAVLLIFTLLAAGRCAAQGGRFLTFENDRFFHTDRYYTNGIQWSVKHAGADVPWWARRACTWLGCDGASLVASQQNFGQLLYTPSDIEHPVRPPLDRPYAALLYYERSYSFLSEDQAALSILSWEAGVTGRPALGEETQKLIHRIFDRPQPQGWDYQIGSTLGLMGTAERRWALPRLGAEWGNGTQLRTAAYVRVALGNILTYAATGVAITIGKDLPLVSAPPSGILTKARTQQAADTRCFFAWLRCTSFAAVEARANAYNVFLDGRIGRDDPEVDSRPLIADTSVGLRFDFPRTRTSGHGPWFLQLKATRRTEEFRAPAPVYRQNFGAVTAGTDW